MIWKEFCKKLCNNGFFFQNNSLENSLICPKNKSASHCPTELFPIYPNNHWTIRRRDDHTVVPSSNRIKLKIVWFLHAPNCRITTIQISKAKYEMGMVHVGLKLINIKEMHMIMALNHRKFKHFLLARVCKTILFLNTYSAVILLSRVYCFR